MSMLMKNYKTLTLFNAQLLRLPLITSHIFTRNSSYVSQKFPDYHVLYKLDSIKTVSIINRLKRTTTLVSGIVVSGFYGLEMIQLMSLDVVNAVAFTGISFTLFTHAIGYYCNNVVGYVYEKKNTKDLIISYVDFWGKRVDIETTVNDINCVEPTSKFLAPMFTIMNITSSKIALKLFLNGKVTDSKRFYDTFGLSL